VAADPQVVELAAELAEDAAERFIRYARIDTESEERSDSYPSTEKQLDLLRLLAAELEQAGLEDVELDEYGYVIATLPSTVDHEVPVFGVLAHVDTSSAVTGANVKPQRVRYEGEAVVLPGDPDQVLREEDSPELADHVGHELITSDGTTLLGADDKAGVAEIMAAVAYLAAHPEIPHGRVRVAFNPDEEVGRGTLYFDLEKFGAVAAYTLDGSTVGELQDETFSGMAATIDVYGRSAHPGTAKGILVNAVRLAAEIVERLPRELAPEATDDRQGFIHPTSISGDSAHVRLTFILRDFDEEQLAAHERTLREAAQAIAVKEPRARVEVASRLSYRNMKVFLDDHPHVVEAAEEAYRRVGLDPRRTPIRGGTDGSMLTEKGLPTPNIFTGGHDYHSEREWVCVEDMGMAAAVIVHLAQVWAERAQARSD
jgi:tripeptide aminopeptidase